MRQLKIGIKLASLQQPFSKALHTAARLGAQGVEIDARAEPMLRDLSHTGLRQLRKMLDDLNLRVCAIAFPTRRGYDIEEDLDRRIAATKRAQQLAYELGASVVINHIGRIPEDSESRGWQTLVQSLTDIGRFGQHVGALLAAETGTEDGADLARLLEALPEGSIGVNFDPGNLVIHGFSARESLSALAPHVLHVHAKDGVRDLARGRGVEVPLGRGSVDFPELLGRLAEQSYQGYLTVERERANDPVQEIGQAVEFLKTLGAA